MGPKTLPTIRYTYMMLVTKYQISAINSYWEKCGEKYLGRTEDKLHIGTPYRGKHFWTHRIPTSCLPTLLIFYTHWTYMLIFRHIFLSNYWWQESDIWKNEHICSMCIKINSQQTGSRNLMGPKMLPTIWGTYMKLVTKHQISAINSCWEKCDEKWAYMFNVYKKSTKSANRK
jgi:hypothetical protein